jgi:hypothetical protein
MLRILLGRTLIGLVCLAGSASALHAQAQPAPPAVQRVQEEPARGTVRPYQGVVQGSFADVVKKQAEMMRISIGMNFTLTGVSDPIADDARLRERTRRNVYQMAVKECELLLEMIASECRIEAINVNLNRNPQNQDSINVSATLNLRAVQKPASQ